MKKLFENPIFHYSFVLTMVAFACGLVIGGVNAITDPIITENRIRAQVEAYEKVLPGIAEFTEMSISGDPSTIVSKIEGKDQNGDVLGYIYVAYNTNKYGYMRIITSIGLDGTILGAEFLEINQTLDVNSTRINLSLYEGLNITEAAPVGDMISGVTGSKNTLVDLMYDVRVAHEKLDIAPQDPYLGWFDGEVTRTADDTFTAEGSVVSRQVVTEGDDIVGYIYEVTKSGVYYDSSQASITLQVGLSVDGEIVGILLPEDAYNHTKGFRNQMITFIENTYIGTSLSEVIILGDGDLVADATNSSRLINEMLVDLKDVVLS
ncbi:MAG: hypothetical protein ACNA7K_00985 [Acholeplasmataceae bacterium]